MKRGLSAGLPVKAAGIAVAVSLGLAAGCGSGGSKPPSAVAGCDMPLVSNPALPVKYMITQELYNEHQVTGEPRSSEFATIFTDGRVHDQGALIGWFTVHENDADLLIYNRTPGEWDSQLTINVFPQPYTAYRAYCTGWSFPNYARSHWEQVLIGGRSSVTPTSATPVGSTTNG